MEYTEDFVEAPWGNICVVRGGRSGKDVVCLHGIVDNAGGLQTLINILQPEYRVHIIELPGCGRSDPYPPGLPLHLVNFVEVVRLVVDHYELDKFYLIGHSMGVQIGLLYNMLYSDKIERFVALDSILYPPIDAENFELWYKNYLETYFDAEIYKKRNSPPDKGPTYTYDEAMALIMKTRGIPKDAAGLILDRSLQKAADVPGKYRFTWDQRIKHVIIPSFTTDFLVKFYSKMNVPHLLILSDQSINRRIQLMNPSIFETFYKNNPNFRLVIVEGNHDVHLTKTEQIGKLISEFLISELPTPRLRTDDNFQDLVQLYKKRGGTVLKSKF